jgi:clan AA aspartic protease (TIGR02281 family)
MFVLIRLAIFLVGSAVAAIAYAAMLGLGLHRHAPPWIVSVSATILVFGPPLVAAGFTGRGRVSVFGVFAGMWSIALLSALPVYFPGERSQAVVSGLALVHSGPEWEMFSRALAHSLPEEPSIADPELPEAEVVSVPVLPPAAPLRENEIALPYEGEGRRLSVPVTFQNGRHAVEREMMVDTGATYTTLPVEVLARLGARPAPDAPTIVLHTANGEREAQVVLLDAVWLGDLRIDGVAIATCEACASGETAGLLGLNVTGNFNLTIDADRHEVVFASRSDLNRRLDVSPFVNVNASLARYPGGRLEVDVAVENAAGRPIHGAIAEIRCGEQAWTVDVREIPPGGPTHARRRLPEHPACGQYQVALTTATW